MDKPETPKGSQERTFQQLAMCLLASDRGRDLEELAGQSGQQKFSPYYLALKLALEGRVDEALTHLRPVMTNGGQPEAASLAVRLLLHQANHYLRRQDYEALSQALDEALRLMPNDAQAVREFQQFQETLPFCYLRLGKRFEVEKLWHQELWRLGPAAIHKLALLHYWSARHGEKMLIAGKPVVVKNLDALWHKTIAYWVSWLNTETYWSEWSKTRAAIYGSEVSPADLKEIRQKLMEDRLPGIFRHYQDEHLKAGREEDARRHRGYLTKLRLERRTNSAWRKFLAKEDYLSRTLGIEVGGGVPLIALIKALQRQENQEDCFGSAPKDRCLPCPWEDLCRLGNLGEEPVISISDFGGPILAADTDLVPMVSRILKLQKDRYPEEEEGERLDIYLSPLGLAAILLEEKNPEAAFRELEGLEASMRQTPKGRRLRAAILVDRGRRRFESKGIDAAISDWEQAHQIIKDLHNLSRSPAFRTLLNSLIKELASQVVKGCLREGNALREKEHYDKAVALLQKGLALADDEHLRFLLADIYCDQGMGSTKDKKYSQARQYFEKALAVKPNYTRAKEGMSTSYNNEAVDILNAKDNPDEAIRLLEIALKHDPNNHGAKRNMAGAYHAKAAKKMKDLDYAYSPEAKVAIIIEAKKLLAKAHEYDPTDNDIIKNHNQLAEVLTKYFEGR